METTTQKSFSTPSLIRAAAGGLARHNVVWSLLVSLLLAMSLAAPILAAPQVSAPRKDTAGVPQKAADIVDIGILVVPQSDDTAHVAVGYHHPVSHLRVKQAIARLSRATGWGVGDLTVIDDRINRDPVTTTALFTLRNAPQEPGGIPALLPYLQAFQDANRIEVIFTNLQVPQYRGVVRFDSPGLSVQLVQLGQGTARYDADIHDHQGLFPALPVGVQGAQNQSRPGEAGPPAARRPAFAVMNSGFLLLLAGGALVIGTCSYLWLVRRLPARSSARTLRL